LFPRDNLPLEKYWLTLFSSLIYNRSQGDKTIEDDKPVKILLPKIKNTGSTIAFLLLRICIFPFYCNQAQKAVNVIVASEHKQMRE
jgi:hypothetical protein